VRLRFEFEEFVYRNHTTTTAERPIYGQLFIGKRAKLAKNSPRWNFSEPLPSIFRIARSSKAGKIHLA
jgi:hypothetical protein